MLVRDRGFTEAWDRAPSSVAEAEAFYNETLLREQHKHESPEAGYLEHG